MENRRNRQLVFGILLFALGFIIAIVAKELGKIARVIIMLGYAVMAAFKLYCVAATVLNLFNPKVIKPIDKNLQIER